MMVSRICSVAEACPAYSKTAQADDQPWRHPDKSRDIGAVNADSGGPGAHLPDEREASAFQGDRLDFERKLADGRTDFHRDPSAGVEPNSAAAFLTASTTSSAVSDSATG